MTDPTGPTCDRPQGHGGWLTCPTHNAEIMASIAIARDMFTRPDTDVFPHATYRPADLEIPNHALARNLIGDWLTNHHGNGSSYYGAAQNLLDHLADAGLEVVSAAAEPSDAAAEERTRIVARLAELGDARMEYITNRGTRPEPQDTSAIDALSPHDQAVYHEAHAARWLASIIAGGTDKGWLPSWRWAEGDDTP